MKDLHDEGAVGDSVGKLADDTRVTSRNVPIQRYKDVNTAAADERSALDGGARHDRPPLRCIQITDPHIGCFLPPDRLAQICERTVEANPDLVFLTGDFFTVEGMREPTEMLTEALRPLRKLGPNKVYACLGNHDLETAAVNDTVRQAVAAIGGRLLVDESLIVETRLGPVRVSGFNYCMPTVAEESISRFYNMFPSALTEGDERVLPGEAAFPVGSPAAFPATEAIVGALTSHTHTGHGTEVTRGSQAPPEAARCAILHICLLHDPTAFVHLPRHALPTLVLSGHTHGGHIGLYSLGLKHATLVRLIGHYDNGLWLNKGNAMWVHRGQGSRSLMSNGITRCGVPSEDSIFYVYVS